MIGIYSVVAYSDAQRTREIGIRMAVGAGRKQILAMILGEGSRLILVGIAVGIAGTLALSQLMAGLLYSVSPNDPMTLVLVSAVVAAAAVVATCIPSLRATRVNSTVCFEI